MVQLLLQYGANDGPGSFAYPSCPYGPGPCLYCHGPGFHPHELRQVEDATDETEPFKPDENSSDKALSVKASSVESEVS